MIETLIQPLTLNSIRFILFFIAVAVIYFTIPKQFQKPFLLVSSFVCYMFETPQYAILLAATIFFNYYAGKAISEQENQKKKKVILTSFIVLNILVLLILKYYNFFGQTLSPLLNSVGLTFTLSKWIVPLGISYYTLMIIDYLVSVYKGTVDWDKDFDGFTDFALYVSFFPQIIAGPINRSKLMLPQFKVAHSFDYGRTVEGMQRFLIGALKKVVLADGIAIVTNGIFSNMSEVESGYTGLILILGQLLYVIRMFGDFSGYSDMAVGVAKILGIDIMENFNAPYSAISVNEFWRRWHISLSSWLRDYIYIPLGGNRKGRVRRYFNSMVVYFVCGLWHAPSWNYAVWGICQSLMVIFENLTFLNPDRKKKKEPGKIVRFIRWLYTMVFFYITLLFVSTKSINDVWYFFKKCFRFEAIPSFLNHMIDLSDNEISVGLSYMAIYWGGMFLAFLIVFWLDRKTFKSEQSGVVDYNPIASLTKRKRWLIYFIAGILILFFFMIEGSMPAQPIYADM